MAKKISIKLGLNDKEFQSKLRKQQKSLRKFSRQVSELGSTMTRNLTLPLAAMGAGAVKLASDFNEAQSKFNTVFSSIQKDAEATAVSLQKNFGLSKTAAYDMVGSTGDLLTGFGFTQQSALELSKQVNELAVDLASFTNFSGGAKGASEALTKALLGERESVKSLGIAITEADLKAFAAQQGLVWKELDRVTKAQLTFNLALQQSKNAVGDYSRTSGEFANQFRLVQARATDLAVELGQQLLPVAQYLITKVQDLITYLSGLSDQQKINILRVSAFVAALGPLLRMTSSMVNIYTKMLPTIKFVAKNISVLRFAVLNLTKAMLANPYLALGAGMLYVGNEVYQAAKNMGLFRDELEQTKTAAERLEDAPLTNMAQGVANAFAAANKAMDEYNKKKAEYNKANQASQKSWKKELEQMQLVDGINKEIIADLESMEQKNGSFGVLSDDDLDLGEEEENVPMAFDTAKVVEQMNNVSSLNDEFGQLGSTLQQVFVNAMQAEENFFKSFIAGMKQAIKALMAQIVAMTIVQSMLGGVPVGEAFKGAMGNVLGGATPFANGGIVSGPTLGLVGEYAGARSNPEVIAPLDKLKGMMGMTSQNVTVTGVISGEDIVLASDRYNKRANRSF